MAFDNKGGSAAAPVTFYVNSYNHAPGCYIKFFSGRTDLQDEALSKQAPAERAEYAMIGPRSYLFTPPPHYAGRHSTHLVQIKFTVEIDAHAAVMEVDFGGKPKNHVVLVNGNPLQQGQVVVPGDVVDARFVMEDSLGYPIMVSLGKNKKNGLIYYNIDSAWHDEGVEGPNLQALVPAQGPWEGGNAITLRGMAINPLMAEVLVGGKPLPPEAVVERHSEWLSVVMPAAEEEAG